MALAHVNATSGSGDGGSTTIAATAANHTGGNLLVVCVVWSSAAQTLSSIADTAGNTYTRHPSSKQDSGSDNTEIFYAKNITGNASNVVTATFSGSSTFRRIMVDQISGADTSAPADQAGIGGGTSATATTSSFTTTQADEIIVAGVGNTNTTSFSAGAAGTIRVNNVGGDSAMEDNIVSSTGSYTGSMVSDIGSTTWFISAASYKQAGGGGGGVTVKALSALGVG